MKLSPSQAQVVADVIQKYGDGGPAEISQPEGGKAVLVIVKAGGFEVGARGALKEVDYKTL